MPSPPPPFDSAKLDDLLAERGVDALLATSFHNVQYLLGNGYRFFLHALHDSLGPSRYLPVVAYRAGRPEDTLYVGARNEGQALEADPVWVPEARTVSWSAGHAAEEAAARLRAWELGAATVAVEAPYLPAEAADALRRALPGVTWADATEILEELRAVKSPAELDLIREATEAVVASIVATFSASSAGESERTIAERLRQEETARGLTFDYCLVAAGPSLNRAPSDVVLRPGAVLSLDSGAHRHGYVADVARMGVAGVPTARHEALLAEVDHVQAAARALVRAGTLGGDLIAAGEAAVAACDDAAGMGFTAHGCGLVTHEVPRLRAPGSPSSPGTHADRPLEAGMVISVETEATDPGVGFVKLEDTVVVGADGPEPLADFGRGWNRVGG